MNGIVWVLLFVGMQTAVEVAGKTPPTPTWANRANESALPLHSELVVSELWATREEAREDVLQRAAAEAGNLARRAAPRIRGDWQVPAWIIEDHLLRERIHIEEVDWTYGPMYRAHLLLDTSPEKRDLVLTEWRDTYVREQLSQVGGGFAFVLVCLGTVLAYLRLDDATRGYYSGWLLSAGITLVAGSGAVLYTWLF